MTTETQAAGSDTTQAGVQATAEGTAPGAGAATDPAAAGAGQATSTQATDTTATDPAAKAGEGKAEEVAYEFKTPEGVTLDQARLDEFTAFAKDRKLSPADAQALVDMAVKADADRTAKFIDQTKAWGAEVAADKALGGDKLPESKATAMRAIDLGPPELKTFLNDTGLGNHPVLFKWAHAIGKAMSEDTHRAGSTAPAPAGSIADRLYGKA